MAAPCPELGTPAVLTGPRVWESRQLGAGAPVGGHQVSVYQGLGHGRQTPDLRYWQWGIRGWRTRAGEAGVRARRPGAEVGELELRAAGDRASGAAWSEVGAWGRGRGSGAGHRASGPQALKAQLSGVQVQVLRVWGLRYWGARSWEFEAFSWEAGLQPPRGLVYGVSSQECSPQGCEVHGVVLRFLRCSST